MGYKYDYTDKHGERRYSNGSPSESEKYLIMWFSSYQGLMPIMFECNNSENFCMDIQYGKVFITKLIDIDDTEIIRYNYKTEPEFIEAIQLAVIKYLELKDADSRV